MVIPLVSVLLDELPQPRLLDAAARVCFRIGLAEQNMRDSGNTLIGYGGYKGTPSADGTIEVVYAILDEHQRKGLPPRSPPA